MSRLIGLMGSRACRLSLSLRFPGGLPALVPLFLEFLLNQCSCHMIHEAEGIFRITAGNSQEEYVRDHLNRGVVPGGMDVHCLAGLIKAWFRELPRGVLDSLSPEQVMQCQSEEDCNALVRFLPPTEAALLDWAVNLMVDVVQEERLNKMNARNIAMVFAPNMTQMADPLTALMYAVQVMNFLKTLIEKIYEKEKENPAKSNEEALQPSVAEDSGSVGGSESNQVGNISDEDFLSHSISTEESHESGCYGSSAEVHSSPFPNQAEGMNSLRNQFDESKRNHTGQLNASPAGSLRNRCSAICGFSYES